MLINRCVDVERLPAPDTYETEDDPHADVDPQVFLKMLPPEEQDMILLNWFERRSQHDIGRLLGLTQPSISYRIKRAKLRLRLRGQLSELIPGEDAARLYLSNYLSRTDVDTLLGYYRLGSQTQVALSLGLAQCSVRFRLLKIRTHLVVLSVGEPGLRCYLDALQLLNSNKSVTQYYSTHPRRSNVAECSTGHVR